ncbi:DUF4405 domain-containing protein [bacterium]|nr:DUF4405 domain-containing protein [bacterium]
MKGKINFVIDALMFIFLAAISGLGFLMKYVLIPGKDRIAKFGRSVDLYFLGLDRHEWGTIHLILGIVMLGLLVLHIVLHWKSIQCLFRRLVGSKKWRIPILFAFSIVSLFLFIFSFLIKIEIRDLKDGSHGHHHVSGDQKVDDSGERKGRYFQTARAAHNTDELDYPIQVRGKMTLAHISANYGIPTAEILSGLNIDASVSSNIQIGHLRKRYGFRMSEVERLIRQYQQTHLK